MNSYSAAQYNLLVKLMHRRQWQILHVVTIKQYLHKYKHMLSLPTLNTSMYVQKIVH